MSGYTFMITDKTSMWNPDSGGESTEMDIPAFPHTSLMRYTGKEELAENFADNFPLVNVKQEPTSATEEELSGPESIAGEFPITEPAGNTNVSNSTFMRIAKSVAQEGNDSPGNNYASLELTVDEHNSELTIKDELLSPEEEHNETSAQGHFECDAMQGTEIDTNNAELCQNPDATAIFSDLCNGDDVNKGIQSFKILPKSTESGWDPDGNTTDVGSCTEGSEWPSSLGESGGKEQHEIEAWRREEHVYSRTETDVQPSTDHLVVAGIKLNMGPLKYLTSSKDVNQCPVCWKEFAKESYLKQHYLTHTGEKPHQCQECDKKFTTSGGLKCHTRTHTGEKPHQCQECGKRFKISAHLKRHNEMHARVKPYKCLECGKQFKSADPLRRHTMIHTGERPHQCQECDKAYISLPKLKEHSKVHSGQRPHICEECGRGFISFDHLRRHKAIHTGTPHECQICGKQFAMLSYLRCHTKTHRADKPHQCHECGKQFIRHCQLQKHSLTHSGEKPYKCKECGKQFTQNCNLKVHYLTHTGEKPHRCLVCKTGFTTLQSLKKHSLIHPGCEK